MVEEDEAGLEQMSNYYIKDNAQKENSCYNASQSDRLLLWRVNLLPCGAHLLLQRLIPDDVGRRVLPSDAFLANFPSSAATESIEEVAHRVSPNIIRPFDWAWGILENLFQRSNFFFKKQSW